MFWQWQQQPGKQYLYGGSTNFLNLTQNDATATDTLPFSGKSPPILAWSKVFLTLCHVGFGPDVPVALAVSTLVCPVSCMGNLRIITAENRELALVLYIRSLKCPYWLSLDELISTIIHSFNVEYTLFTLSW